MTRKRTRGLLGPNPQSLGQEFLTEGQVTTPVRIRAERTALAAFASLTAAERGEIVEAWHRSLR